MGDPGGDGSKFVPRTVGRYVVYGEIASGGMATVHFGRLTGVAGFARSVAIKRLHPHIARDPEFVKMFLDEARVAARVTHPNVVATLDVVAIDDELFLVMDYVRGASVSQLSRILRASGEAMPPLVATGIVAATLHGLHAAHEAKNEAGERLDIVHRDVSPQNILVGTDGVARVLDFGIAKAAGRLQTTRDGQLKGKLSYMAPEQIQGEMVTRRTDVYAAAVVMWEALTGERLFQGENEANVLARVLRGKVRKPTDLVPSLALSLDRIVMRGLSRDPGERYATAREMAQEIEDRFGVATAAEIGDWVERVAARELAARAKRISDIERSASDGETEIPVIATEPVHGAPDAPTPVGQRPPEVPTRRRPSMPSVQLGSALGAPLGARVSGRRPWLALGLGVAVVTFAGIALSLARPTPPALAADAHVASPPPGELSPSAALVLSSLPEAADLTPPAGASLAPPPPPSTPAQTARPATPRASPAHPRSADCAVPFTTDAKGHVHFKPQCM